ncbi:GNAT family N-acetyltransferase [Stappia sp.]|uniref:GNAT family N-acetyltransferase n=1 Tax=Stappia sp. TaxID=1870903 RepID=UPI003A9A50A4
MIDIRPFLPADAGAARRVNEASLPAVNSLSEAELLALAEMSVHTLVAVRGEDLVGLLVCLDQGADYDSRNFTWLKDNLGRFAYVDRIALAPEARGAGIGQLFYQDLIARLAAEPARATAPLACEVNTRPPNPGSLRFHQRLGFAEIGAQDLGDKAVVYLSRPLAANATGSASR